MSFHNKFLTELLDPFFLCMPPYKGWMVFGSQSFK